MTTAPELKRIGRSKTVGEVSRLLMIIVGTRFQRATPTQRWSMFC